MMSVCTVTYKTCSLLGENKNLNIQRVSAYTFTLWRCSEQHGDKPVLNLSAKINVHAGEILA